MKLQILIPQYKEEDSIIKPLLDSIAIQQNIDFNEVGVIICNDGSDTFLSQSLITSYPFSIEYHKEPHRGVSGTRNACFNYATADYVMFCDADDMFYNACGLYIIFPEMTNGFDCLISCFTEETRDPRTNTPIYINHDMDTTFVHGKIYRRKYLLDNNIRWNENLTIHEDSFFNCLCQRLSPENSKYCPTPFYLWKWRDDSVCRHDPLYLNKTMTNMLESNTALVKEFVHRSRRNDAIFYTTSMIYDTYYSLNCDRWWSTEGHSYLYNAEIRFKKYWNDFKELFNECSSEARLQIVSQIKNRFFGEGLLLERITFDDWIKHIEELEEKEAPAQ